MRKRQPNVRSYFAKRGRKELITQFLLPVNATYVEVARLLVHSRTDWLVDPPEDRDGAIQLIERDAVEREMRFDILPRLRKSLRNT